MLGRVRPRFGGLWALATCERLRRLALCRHSHLKASLVGWLSPHRQTYLLGLNLHWTRRYRYELALLSLDCLLLHLLLSCLAFSLCSEDCYKLISRHITQLRIDHSGSANGSLRYGWHGPKHIGRHCVGLLARRALCHPKIH